VVRFVLVDVEAVVPAGAVREPGGTAVAATRGRCRAGADGDALGLVFELGPHEDLPVHRVLVVHRNVHTQPAGRDHGEEREHHVGGAPVVRVLFRRAVCTVRRTDRRVDDRKARRAGLELVVVEGAGLVVFGLGGAI